MSRKEEYITIEDGGNRLLIQIKQMSAIQQERWLNRMLILLCGNTETAHMASELDVKRLISKFQQGKLTEEKLVQGEGGLDKFLGALVGVLGALDYEKVEPLYNELLGCCSHVPDPNNRLFCIQLTPDNVESIIMDFRTLYKLRWQALKLNFNFFGNGAGSPITTPKKAPRISRVTRTSASK